MTPRTKATLHWIVAALALVVSVWSFNNARSFWLAAQSDVARNRIYSSRGNVYFFLSAGFFLASVLNVVAASRSRKKQQV
jgi:hypothetical protein